MLMGRDREGDLTWPHHLHLKLYLWPVFFCAFSRWIRLFTRKWWALTVRRKNCHYTVHFATLHPFRYIDVMDNFHIKSHQKSKSNHWVISVYTIWCGSVWWLMDWRFGPSKSSVSDDKYFHAQIGYLCSSCRSVQMWPINQRDQSVEMEERRGWWLSTFDF